MTQPQGLLSFDPCLDLGAAFDPIIADRTLEDMGEWSAFATEPSFNALGESPDDSINLNLW
jgi:hypothetical protein